MRFRPPLLISPRYLVTTALPEAGLNERIEYMKAPSNARYFLTFHGYTVHPQDRGFASLKEARAEQRSIIQEDLAKARRKWGRASLMKAGDSFAIHACRDSQSAMWSAGNIVAA